MLFHMNKIKYKVALISVSSRSKFSMVANCIIFTTHTRQYYSPPFSTQQLNIRVLNWMPSTCVKMRSHLQISVFLALLVVTTCEVSTSRIIASKGYIAKLCQDNCQQSTVIELLKKNSSWYLCDFSDQMFR